MKNIVFMSGADQPLTPVPPDRRYWAVDADVPIPAPANWPRASTPPTDKPVLRNGLWHGTRCIAQGLWLVCVFGDAVKLDVVAEQAYVVDDFGTLQPVDDNLGSANHEFYWSHWCIDAAACDWMDAEAAAHERTRQEQIKAQRTRALLRPQPVTVEIVTEPPHPLCVASIVLGHDPRTDAPMYSVHDQGGDYLLITHAQLCALALAANALVKSNSAKGQLQ